jgi:hypothetical protein
VGLAAGSLEAFWSAASVTEYVAKAARDSRKIF